MYFSQIFKITLDICFEMISNIGQGIHGGCLDVDLT